MALGRLWGASGEEKVSSLKIGDLVKHKEHGIGIVITLAPNPMSVFLGNGLRVLTEMDGWEGILVYEEGELLANFVEMVQSYLVIHESPQKEIDEAFREIAGRFDGALDFRKRD